jgi:hypothetical protein
MNDWSKVNGFWATNTESVDTALIYDGDLCVSTSSKKHRKTTSVPLHVIINLLEQQGYKVTK